MEPLQTIQAHSGRIHIIVCRSYADRCISLLDRVLQMGIEPAVSILHFTEYEEQSPRHESDLDKQAKNRYWQKAKAIEARLDDACVPHRVLPISFDSALHIAGILQDREWDHLLVDVSSMPRFQIVGLIASMINLSEEVSGQLWVGYTKVDAYERSEESFSSGVKGFAAIPGLSGKIRHRENMAIIIAGYEGNRAYAAFKKLAPNTAHVMLGDRNEPSHTKEARRHNHQLLSNHSVSHSLCSCLDPRMFMVELREVISMMRRRKPSANLYIVPLGTKLQTVGATALHEENRDMQYFFPMPAHRRISARGSAESCVIDIRTLRSRSPETAPTVSA